MFDARLARLLTSFILILGYQWVDIGGVGPSGEELRAISYLRREEDKRVVAFKLKHDHPLLPLPWLQPSKGKRGILVNATNAWLSSWFARGSHANADEQEKWRMRDGRQRRLRRSLSVSDTRERRIRNRDLVPSMRTPGRKFLQQQETRVANPPFLNCSKYSNLNLSLIEGCRIIPISFDQCCRPLYDLANPYTSELNRVESYCQVEFFGLLSSRGFNETAVKFTCLVPRPPPSTSSSSGNGSGRGLSLSSLLPAPPNPPPLSRRSFSSEGGFASSFSTSSVSEMASTGSQQQQQESQRQQLQQEHQKEYQRQQLRLQQQQQQQQPPTSHGRTGDTFGRTMILPLACALGGAMLLVLLLLFCLRRRIGRACRVLFCLSGGGEKTVERGLNRGSSSAPRSDGSRDVGTPAKPEGSGAGGRKDGRFSLNRPPEPYTVSKFPLETLSRATRGFNPDCLIGEPGGFGKVYRGTLDDGRTVAVKMMKGEFTESKYGQFLAEVELQSRLHHLHLCELIGYCEGEGSWLLVYPFIPGGTLFEHLHWHPGAMGHKVDKLDWLSRVRVALQVSKAIRYLHEEVDPPVLHRDVKSANILLDQNKRAKLADFGLAKLGQSILLEPERGGVEPRRLCGTYGYMAPEYMVWGKLTARNDVYAFGVVVLELVTGRRAVVRGEEGTLATWVRPYLDNINDFKSIVDPSLLKWGADDLEEIYTLACLAGECTHGTERLRPAMSSVVERISRIANSHPGR